MFFSMNLPVGFFFVFHLHIQSVFYSFLAHETGDTKETSRMNKRDVSLTKTEIPFVDRDQMMFKDNQLTRFRHSGKMQTKRKKKGRRKKKLFLSITTGDHRKFNSRGDGELMGIGKQHQRHFSMVTNSPGKRKGE